MNLEKVLSEQNRSSEAEPFIRRAVEVNSLIAKASPDDLQIRFDLTLQQNNLGMLLHHKGDEKQAIDSLLEARTKSESLLTASPDQPRYREHMAGVLTNLAGAMASVGDSRAMEVYKKALPIYEKLVAEYPDNINYKIGQARCLQNFGPIVAGTKRPEEAISLYRKALSLLRGRPGQVPSAEQLRVQAEVLNNLGDLQRRAPGGRCRIKSRSSDRHLPGSRGTQAAGSQGPPEPGDRTEQPRRAAGQARSAR